MEKYSPISLINHPIIFFKDKIYTAWDSKASFTTAFVLWIMAVISFCGGIQAISSDYNSTFLLLSIFLFVFGLINVYFSTALQRVNIRFDREKKSFFILHELIEMVRDYRAEKTNLEEKQRSETLFVIKYLRSILEKLNDNYMIPRHQNRNVAITLKYLYHGYLHHIQIGGDNKINRDSNAEPYSQCYVHHVLCDGKKLKFLFVQNINKFDNNELKYIGKQSDNIKERAEKQGYKTFLALPIKTGNIGIAIKGAEGAIIRTPLGFLGFDLPIPYGFGIIHSQEIQFLACFVDMISELVQDLMLAKEIEDAIEESQKGV